MELALDLLVIVLQVSWTVAYPGKPALPDLNPHIKPVELDDVDKQVNDYLLPILSSQISISTPAPRLSFQQKDISQITDLNDLIKYLPPSFFTRKIKFGGKKGNLLQITAIKPKSKSTSEAPLAMLLATNPKKEKIVKFIDSVVNNIDGHDANQSPELNSETSDLKAFDEEKGAEEPREEELAKNNNGDLEKTAVPFLTDLELRNVFNEVLQESDWNEDNADSILPNSYEPKEEKEIKNPEFVEQSQEDNQENDKVNAEKELKDREDHLQKDDNNEILINKEKKEAHKTDAVKKDHNDHEPKKDMGHGHHHHEMRNKEGQNYEAKDQENEVNTSKELYNQTVSIDYENDQKFVNDDEKNNPYKDHKHQQKHVHSEINDDYQAKNHENYDNPQNDNEKKNYQENGYSFHEKHASNQDHQGDHGNEDKEHNYQETSHERAEKQVSSTNILNINQPERNNGQDQDLKRNDEDKYYHVSDDKYKEYDHEAGNHDALIHDERFHFVHDHHAKTQKTSTEDILDEMAQEVVDTGKNQEILLSDDNIARLQEALTKAEEAENQLKSRSNDCSPAELPRSLTPTEFTKKSDHDDSNAKFYTLSFSFNK